MLIVAVTGGIGSGKSTVVELFRAKGVPIIDTDVIAREVVAQQKVLSQLISIFGQSIVKPDGTLDRQALRRLAFANDENRIKLQDLLHPLIFRQTMEQINNIDAPYCLVVIPLLYESRHPYTYDRVLVIDVEPGIQLQRAMRRDNGSAKSIKMIIAAQASREQRLSIADDVINNNGDINELVPQVEALHTKYLKLAAAKVAAETS